MRIITGVVTSPTIVSRAASTNPVINVVETAVFSFSWALAPKSWEMTTEQPILLPTATAIKIMVIG